jgi:hypothetical protein
MRYLLMIHRQVIRHRQGHHRLRPMLMPKLRRWHRLLLHRRPPRQRLLRQLRQPHRLLQKSWSLPELQFQLRQSHRQG